MHWIQHRWEKQTRYYAICLQPDLWGQWILTRRWGRRGAALGQTRDQPCASYAEAEQRLAQLEKRRRQRHYSRTSPTLLLDEPS